MELAFGKEGNKDNNVECKRVPVYEKEKYREMLLEVQETGLGYFGLDRTVYGVSIRKKNKKWWYEIREEGT